MKSPKKHNINICMAGTWLSSSNVGDNAILCGILDSLNKSNNINLTVFTSKPQRVIDIYRLNAYAPKKQPLQLFSSLKKADIFLFTGGTPFYDDILHMLYFTFLTVYCKIFNIPVVIFGISLRPINSTISKLLLKIIVFNSSYIGFREHDSINRFISYFPKKEANILPDPAIQISRSKDIDSHIEIKKEHKYVCICPRNFSAKEGFRSHHYDDAYNIHELSNYIRVLKDTTEWLIQEKGYRVIFLPMHIHDPDDDREIGKLIYSQINDDIRKQVTVIDKQFDPIIVKEIFKQMNFVIGVRFHSIVLASSSNVPVISIGYAKKNDAIMNFIYQKKFINTISRLTTKNIQEQVIDIERNIMDKKMELKKIYTDINKIYQKELNKILSLSKRSAQK